MINSIILQSGGLFDFDNPEGSDFTIEDVAHNTAHLCRFNGGCDVFFSVAQHMCNVGWLLRGTPFEKEGHLHDGPEAFYGDMTTWLKKLCPDYRAQLGRGERAFAAKFGLPAEMSPEVKRADYLALACERRVLFKTTTLSRGNDGFHHLLDISEGEIEGALQLVDMEPWSPRLAKRNYLERWEQILAEEIEAQRARRHHQGA